MKSKTMILMVAAVGCGLVASYLTSRMLAQQQPVEEEKVKILVAKQKIPLGTLIKDPEKLFVEKEFIKGQEPKGALVSFDQIKDKRLAKTINADYHLTLDDLWDKDKHSSMQNQIPPGYRAIAIQVRADTNVAGFTLPDARVDVVYTVRAGEKDSVSKIILQNMRVLAVDTKDVRDQDGTSRAMPSSTVTLLVKPEEAEEIAIARSMGDLSLILRGYDDPDPVNTRGRKATDVIKAAANSVGPSGDNADNPGGGASPLAGVPDVKTSPAPAGKAEPPPPPPPPAPKTHTLRVWNGESLTTAVFIEGADTQIDKSDADAAPRPAKTPPGKAVEAGAPADDVTVSGRSTSRPSRRLGQ